MDGGGGEWVRGRCIGRGSTAAVYLAAATSGGSGGLFAVKSSELSRAAPLQREQKILSSLCSPHVVSCLGSDVTAEPDGRVFYNLLMEYLPGGSLAEAIKRRGGMRERAIRGYTRGILGGLAYLHARGVIHCDVKGQNILLGGGGGGDATVKLADLGCARWVDGSGDREIIGGTPLYMAPEVARGEEQGAAADIWALGCTVIEMATGSAPWGGVACPVAAIHRIAFSDDAPEMPRSVSDDARDFLGRCLVRDPRKRWSAAELLSHPFLSCDEEFPAGQIERPKRASPKSILDQEFWDSWPEEEDHEADEASTRAKDEQMPPRVSARERLLQLVVGRPSPPPPASTATCEEIGWVTVRSVAALSADRRASMSGVEDTVGAPEVDDGGQRLADSGVTPPEISVLSCRTHLRRDDGDDVTKHSSATPFLLRADLVTFQNRLDHPIECKELSYCSDYDYCRGHPFPSKTNK